MKIAKPNRSAASKKSTRSVLRTASPVPETQIDPAIALQRVTALPTTHHNPTHLQALQRAVGNHAVTHILNRRTRQIQRSVGANHAIDLVVQRAIEAGKLNLVGEKHAYTAKEKATEAEEKAFIKDRYGFSDDQFWDETTFTYDDEGKTKHGDPPKLRAQKFALDALEPLEEAEERYKAYIGAVGNNQEEVKQEELPKIFTALSEVNDRFDEVDAEVDVWADEALANEAQLLDVWRAFIDDWKKKFEVLEITLQHNDPDQVKMGMSVLSAVFKQIPGNITKLAPEGQEQNRLDRSVQMLIAAQLSGKMGVWRVGNNHIKDLDPEGTFEHDNVTLTSREDFEKSIPAREKEVVVK